MNAIYQLNADDLDDSFVDAIKAAFKDKEIEIVVYERDETAYLLRSPANRDHLLRAIDDVEKSQNTVVAEQEQVSVRLVAFHQTAFDDYSDWARADKKLFERIRRIIIETAKTSFDGLGKPEPLKQQLKGYWSRRITDEHRLVS